MIITDVKTIKLRYDMPLAMARVEAMRKTQQINNVDGSNWPS